MTTNLLTDLGEELMIKNDLSSKQYDIGLYDDSVDTFSGTSDLSDITTEPENSNYSRATDQNVTARDINGNWGIDNDSTITFDFSDVTEGDTEDQNVDALFVVHNFQASDTNDSGTNDHVIANPALSQTRSIGSIDELKINSGDLEIKVD